MKYIILLFSIAASSGFINSNKIKPVAGYVSPLANFSNEWNDVKYEKCNTAATASYMSAEEKKIIYILNLVKTNPVLFASTVLAQYPAFAGKAYLKTNNYYISLMAHMKTMSPKSVLQPDKECFESAHCHARTSGLTSYTGHQRLTKECNALQPGMGECISYGIKDPLDIVLALLIDEDVPSLGHRNIFLTIPFKNIGVSIQPHKEWRTNAVIDFSN